MNPWIKTIIGILMSISILIVVLIVGSIYMLNNSLPKYTGTESLNFLTEEIEIYRDSNGVAYINAQSEEDAYFALGYVHAQERLFQMDIARRAGEGRLSEILGSKTIFFDKMFRTLGLSRLVKLNYSKMDDISKTILISYSNGVNEFIRKSPEKFTIEFDILGYKPYRWEPEHSLLLTKMMAWELNISWWGDLALSHLIQRFGADKVKDILPDFDENSPFIIPKHLSSSDPIPIEMIETDKQFRKLFGSIGTHIGSNNWVVSGSKSISGKPIIANDPHLSYSIPGKWFVVSIKTLTHEMAGFTIPGIPGIVIGKNKNISWVLTNIMADDTDFYIEKLDSTQTKYFFNDEWHQLDIQSDTINVRDSAQVIFDIKRNHRGAIISDIHTYEKIFPADNENSADISMRWSALGFSEELTAFYNINHAKNWTEFKSALELFYSPGQNFVYADSDGNIGYLAGVKLPKRKNNSPTFIFDGTNDKNDWDGFVEYSENPSLFNPEDEYIASANNKIIDNYPYHISNLWEPKSRINRITELLNSKERHGIEDFKKYQLDLFSHFAKELLPYLFEAFNQFKINNDNAKTALYLLEQWDFVLEANSQVPSIYAAFLQKLIQNVFQDELGDRLFKEYVFLANIPYRVIPKLLRENTSEWFDNIETEKVEIRDDIIRKSFIDGIEFLENQLGNKMVDWQWGKLHKVTFNHFFHGTSTILDNILDVGPFGIGGDGTTINNAEYSFTDPYKNTLGPSMRYIYDFSKPDVFKYILPTGQSGHFYSDYYDNMTDYWLKGKYFSVNTNLDSIKINHKDLLKLVPTR